jgi:hypothetical protein
MNKIIAEDYHNLRRVRKLRGADVMKPLEDENAVLEAEVAGLRPAVRKLEQEVKDENGNAREKGENLYTRLNSKLSDVIEKSVKE